MVSNKDIYEQQQEILKQLEEIRLKLNEINSKTLIPKLKDRIEVERW